MTKEQIKEALDALRDYCINCEDCFYCDLRDNGRCFFDDCTPSIMDTERIAEVIADEHIH